MYDYPPEFDGPTHCEVCGKDVYHITSECVCPDCPVCGEPGRLDCFGSHVAALPQRYTYEVIWDNGNACDSLGVCDSKEEAQRMGEDWLMEMCGIDPNPEEAAEAYSYEILEPEEAMNTAEDIRLAISTGDKGVDN